MKQLFNVRKQKILEHISGNESVSVKVLSQMLQVSEATIRTDLDVLEKSGKIQRFHGGARLVENRHKQEYDYLLRKSLNFDNKQLIGQKGAQYVESNDAIVCDASTTAFAMVKALIKREELKHVTIIPFGIWLSIELLGYDQFNILMPSGYINHSLASIGGNPSREFFDDLIIHKAFLGAWGISNEQGLTDRHLQQVELKKQIVNKALETTILVDGSKFNQSGISSYCSMKKVARIITDSTAPYKEIELIRKRGVEILIAN